MSRQIPNSASPCASGPPFQPAALLNAINVFLQKQIFLGGIDVVGPVTGGGFLAPQATSVATLQAIQTANGLMVAGSSVIPTMGIITTGQLGFYQLRAGSGGDFIPNDYNVVTNNVSWYQCL